MKTDYQTRIEPLLDRFNETKIDITMITSPAKEIYDIVHNPIKPA